MDAELPKSLEDKPLFVLWMLKNSSWQLSSVTVDKVDVDGPGLEHRRYIPESRIRELVADLEELSSAMQHCHNPDKESAYRVAALRLRELLET